MTEPGKRLLFIAGQVGWNEHQKIVSDFVEQFDKALNNVVAVLNEAGGRPEQVTRLVMYVTDKGEYQRQTRELGDRYRAHMGRHFPAMVLVEVKKLAGRCSKSGNRSDSSFVTIILFNTEPCCHK